MMNLKPPPMKDINSYRENNIFKLYQISKLYFAIIILY